MSDLEQQILNLGYGEAARRVLDGTLVSVDGCADYSGWGSAISRMPDGRFRFVDWSWGSCDLCDAYGLSSDAAERAMRDEMTEFTDLSLLRKFLTRAPSMEERHLEQLRRWEETERARLTIDAPYRFDTPERDG